jgi:hypothetical protein
VKGWGRSSLGRRGSGRNGVAVTAVQESGLDGKRASRELFVI